MNSVTAIVAAIYIIEGGVDAVPPYGIMDLKAEWSEAETPAKRKRVQEKCKEWCENTVRLNNVRWMAKGATGCFYDFLGDKYCPKSSDPAGNSNWKRNIKERLGHFPCDCWKDARVFSVRNPTP